MGLLRGQTSTLRGKTSGGNNQGKGNVGLCSAGGLLDWLTHSAKIHPSPLWQVPHSCVSSLKLKTYNLPPPLQCPLINSTLCRMTGGNLPPGLPTVLGSSSETAVSGKCLWALLTDWSCSIYPALQRRRRWIKTSSCLLVSCVCMLCKTDNQIVY